jgi:hypothetical protein
LQGIDEKRKKKEGKKKGKKNERKKKINKSLFMYYPVVYDFLK